MASVNRVTILGNAGRDPEIRYATNGTAVVNVSLATSRSWKDKAGEKQEETEWHRVVAYDKLAEIIGQYVKKGSSIYVEGRLKTRKWQDKDGKDVYATEVIAEQMQLLGGREEATPAARPAPTRTAPSRTSSTAFDDMPSDVPF